MLKRCMSIVLASTMLMSITAPLGVSAHEDEFSLSAGTSVNEVIKIQAEDCENVSDQTMTDGSRTLWHGYNEERIEYKVNIPVSGDYELSATGAALWDVKLWTEIDGNKIETVPLPFQSASEYTYSTSKFAQVYLTAGEHTVSFEIGGEYFKFDYFTLKNIACDEYIICNEMNEAKNSEQVFDILNKYKDILNINPEAGTAGYIYPQLSFGSMINKEYTSLDDISTAYMQALVLENESQTVTLYGKSGEKLTSVMEPEFTVSVKCDYIRQGEAVIAALYDGDKLVSVKNKERADEAVINLDFNEEALPENVKLKVFVWDSIESAKPHVQAGAYETFYVSTMGDDNATGDKNAPFATIGRALEAAKQVTDEMTGDVEIIVGEGVYFTEEALTINETHSGKNGYDVVIKAANPKRKPVVSGGVKVEGWKKQSDTPIWVADLDIEDTRNLYINDFPAILARSKYTYRASEPYNIDGSNFRDDGLTMYKANFPRSLTNIDGVNLVWHNLWTNQRTPAAGFLANAKNVMLRMKQRVWYVSEEQTGYAYAVGFDKPFYIENAKELLDEKGEFWFDKVNKKVYYYPFDEENMETAEVYAGVTDKILDVRGSSKTAKASNIRIENIEFKYTTLVDVNNNGTVFNQADETYIPTATGKSSQMFDGSTSVEFADNITIEGCVFRCLGATGLRMADGVSNTVITGNVFCDISGTGIVLGSYAHSNKIDASSERCHHVEISNNLVHRVAAEYMGLMGIIAYYVHDVKIVHNDIKDVPYSGISLGWGWGGSGNVDECKNIQIAYNKIENVAQVLVDGGQIYTLGAMENTHIANNYCINSGTWHGGIYLDEGSSHMFVRNNVVKDCEQWFFARANAKISDIYASNNYSDTNVSNIDENEVTLKNTTVAEDENWNISAQRIIDDAGIEDGVIDNISDYDFPSWRKQRIYTVPTERFEKSDSNNVWLEPDEYVAYDTTKPGLFFKTWGHMEMYQPAGFWVEYEVEVSTAAQYSVSIIGSALRSSDVEYSASISVDGTVINDKVVINKYSWDRYIGMFHDCGKTAVLTPGKHTVRITSNTPGWYFGGVKIFNNKIESSQSDYDEGVIAK